MSPHNSKGTGYAIPDCLGHGNTPTNAEVMRKNRDEHILLIWGYSPKWLREAQVLRRFAPGSSNMPGNGRGRG